MEKYIHTMQKTAELSDTSLDGVEYVYEQLKGGQFQATVTMLHDLVSAFYQMETSIQMILQQLENRPLEEQTKQVREALDLLVSAYEERNSGKALELMQFVLKPAYLKWHRTLNQSLAPFIQN